jgi:DNA-binding response OmpR family regulator
MSLQLLIAVPPKSLERFQQELSLEPQFALNFVHDLEAGGRALREPSRQTDVFIVDNSLGDTYDFIKDIRHSYPRLIIILVDEGADFALPGRADDISTTPFQNHDLITRIKRLNEDRRLQTLRADALPPVRSFAKAILAAGKGKSKQQAAAEAVHELGYDYVAYYSVSRADNPTLLLVAQTGEEDLLKIAPKNPDYQDSLMGWVVQNGQSRTVGPEDSPNHPFIVKRRLESAVCIPVGTALRFGVLLACRQEPTAISSENVMMLELISAQLASALAKEER